jgi:cap1 methyltransferase
MTLVPGWGAAAAKRHKAGNAAATMMAKMGYKEGKGLGKSEQGIVDPVQASEQKGRRGLGFALAEVVVSDDLKWAPEQEDQYVGLKEEVVWMPEPANPPPSDMEQLKEWIKRGPRPTRMEEETEFCDAEIVRNVCLCKSVFDKLSSQELRTARSNSNPFETIGKAIFQNRAALKMANMDSRFEMMFTDPKNEDGQSVLNIRDLLYFADICAGPGGFSEYVLWRKKWEARGFGFTLTGPNNFKLEEFLAASTETFEPHYGKDPVGGDGNIYDPQNLIAFRNFVLENTGSGVHFVMADGGFSVEGQENNQEILSKRLYLCQFLCALGILRTGGHFVCKLFDCFTSFSVGLIYLMYHCFDRVCIFKPHTSRPANSERYIVCKGKKTGTTTVENHLFILNCELDAIDRNNRESEGDIVDVVPPDVIKSDAAFSDYMLKSNADLGRRQIFYLSKVKAFAEDTSLIEGRQNELKRSLLKLWNVPDEIRTLRQRDGSAMQKFCELMRPVTMADKAFQSKPTNLKRSNLSSLEHHNSFSGMVLGEDPVNPPLNPTRGFLISMSKYNSLLWNLTQPAAFNALNVKLNLPTGTLLFVEQVYEMSGESRGQKKMMTIHVIDALFLGDMDVRHKELSDRLMLAEKLVRAIRKPTLEGQMTVRVKQLMDLTEMENVFNDRLEIREFKSGLVRQRLAYNLEEVSDLRDNNRVKYMEVSGLLVVPLISHRYLICWSKSQRKFYYFDKQTNKSEFVPPANSIAGVTDLLQYSYFWKWESNGRNTTDDVVSTQISDPEILDRDSFRLFFLSKKAGP